jgi:hypothetical protein
MQFCASKRFEHHNKKLMQRIFSNTQNWSISSVTTGCIVFSSIEKLLLSHHDAKAFCSVVSPATAPSTHMLQFCNSVINKLTHTPTLSGLQSSHQVTQLHLSMKMTAVGDMFLCVPALWLNCGRCDGTLLSSSSATGQFTEEP